MVLCRLSSKVSSVNRSSMLMFTQPRQLGPIVLLAPPDRLAHLLLPTPASPISSSLNKWSYPSIALRRSTHRPTQSVSRRSNPQVTYTHASRHLSLSLSLSCSLYETPHGSAGPQGKRRVRSLAGARTEARRGLLLLLLRAPRRVLLPGDRPIVLVLFARALVFSS
jgi:hypothetical protein